MKPKRGTGSAAEPGGEPERPSDDFLRVSFGGAVLGLEDIDPGDDFELTVTFKPLWQALNLHNRRPVFRSIGDELNRAPASIDLHGFCSALVECEPDCLLALFAPAPQQVVASVAATELIGRREELLTMASTRGQARWRVSRLKSYVEFTAATSHGDPAPGQLHAMRALRIAFQLEEVFERGALQLPIGDETRAILAAVAGGEAKLAIALGMLDDSVARLDALPVARRIPDEQHALANWLEETQLRHWSRSWQPTILE